MNGKYGSGAWRHSDINGVGGKEGWIRLIGVGLGRDLRAERQMQGWRKSGIEIGCRIEGRFWGSCLPLLGDEAGGATMVAWDGGRERDGWQWLAGVGPRAAVVGRGLREDSHVARANCAQPPQTPINACSDPGQRPWAAIAGALFAGVGGPIGARREPPWPRRGRSPSREGASSAVLLDVRRPSRIQASPPAPSLSPIAPVRRPVAFTSPRLRSPRTASNRFVLPVHPMSPALRLPVLIPQFSLYSPHSSSTRPCRPPPATPRRK